MRPTSPLSPRTHYYLTIYYPGYSKCGSGPTARHHLVKNAECQPQSTPAAIICMLTPWGLHKHIKGSDELCLTFPTNCPHIVQTLPAQNKCMISHDYPHSTTCPPKSCFTPKFQSHSSLCLTFHINPPTHYSSSTFKMYLESDHFPLFQNHSSPGHHPSSPRTCAQCFHSHPLSYSTLLHTATAEIFSMLCIPFHASPEISHLRRKNKGF